MVSTSNFGLQDPGFESCWRQNSAHYCMVLHCTEPFIMTLPLSQYDLNDVGRDVGHKIIIVSKIYYYKQHVALWLNFQQTTF